MGGGVYDVTDFKLSLYKYAFDPISTRNEWNVADPVEKQANVLAR